MKPAGRERDKQVGILKGFKVTHPEWHGIYPHEAKNIKEWSTNRNTAWELWDELKNKFHKATYMETSYGQGHHIYLTDCCEFNIKIKEGKDFADCVSQAWIQWKEVKKCD